MGESDSPETKGNRSDFAWLIEEKWLRHTAVVPRIYEKRGRWHVVMVYAAVDQPLRFLCRWLKDFHSLQKAKLHANLFQRTVQKDTRGILKINKHAFTYCVN